MAMRISRIPQRTTMNMTRKYQGLLDNTIWVKLAKGGATALLIKVAAAGLSFLMFASLANTMSPSEYGRYGTGFALATILAVIGSFGMRMLVLRFASIYDDKGENKLLLGVLRTGYVTVLAGCGFLAIMVGIIAAYWPNLEHRSYLMPAAVFTIVLGIAEYQAHAIRAFGKLTSALVPRDIFWRIGVLAISLFVVIGALPALTASNGLWLTALMLLLVTAAQALMEPRTRPSSLFRSNSKTSLKEWRHVALGLWGTSVVRMAVPNLTILILAVVLPADEVGAYFAATRISMLLKLFQMAGGMVGAPMLSRAWAGGDTARAQSILKWTAIPLLIPTLLGFLTFVAFGDTILGFFSEDFRFGHPILLILSLGYAGSAFSGLTLQSMEIFGQERVYLKILITVNLLGLVLLYPATMLFGWFGAAIMQSGTLIGWNLACVVYLKNKLTLDPSVLSLFSPKQNKITN